MIETAVGQTESVSETRPGRHRRAWETIRRPLTKAHARLFIVHGVFIWATLIAWGVFGNLNSLNGRLFILLLLFGLLLFEIPSNLGLSLLRRAIVPVGAAIAAGVLLFLSTDRLYTIGVLLVFLWGFENLAPLWGREDAEAVPLFGLLFFAWGLAFALETVAIVSWSLQSVSTGYTAFLGRVFLNSTIVIGPSVSGLWVLLFAVAYTLGAAFSRRIPWKALAVAFGFAVSCWTVFLVVQSSANVFPQEAGVLANSVRWLFPILVLPIVLFSLFFRARERSAFLLGRRSTVLGVVSLAFLAIVTCLQMQSWDFTSSGGKRILFWNKGYLDWDSATFGKYGSYSGGMFGHLPVFLELDGFHVSHLNSDRLAPEHLAETDVFAMINLGRRWEEGEVDTIWAFVERGGSLLILGDHTNVFGLQDTYNELLKRINIRFEFDSAFPCRGGWENCQSFARHPILAGARSRGEAGIDVGASLTIGRPSFPLITGPLSFSDEGNPYNVGGSLLGNYSYEQSEEMGDMCLLAAAHYGRGKVLVFGDTTSFQNGSVTSIYSPFLHNVFTWLSRRTAFSGWYWITSVGFSMWLALLAIVGASLRGSWLVGFVLPLVLAASVPCSDWIAARVMGGIEVRGPLAAIDYYHIPWVSRGGDEGRGIGALYLNLERNGFIPVSLSSFDREKVFAAALVVILSPLRPISAHETNRLLEYMAGGGQVVLSVGYEEKEGSGRLLEATGLDIEARSLGRAPNTYYKDKKPMDPEFMDAWPIVVREDAPPGPAGILPGVVHDFFVTKGDRLAVYREYGKGGMLFVSDSRFFTNRNVEGMTAWNLGNINFIRNMLTRMNQMRQERRAHEAGGKQG